MLNTSAFTCVEVSTEWARIFVNVAHRFEQRHTYEVEDTTRTAIT